MASASGGHARKVANKYNLVVMGDQHCGKSSLIERYMNGRYDPNYIQTIGSDYCKKEVELNGLRVTLYVFDTAGQVNMKTVIKSVYRRAQGILLVFDFARLSTFKNLKGWIDLIKQNCDIIPEMVVVGNKADLEETYRKVSTKEAQLLAVHQDLKFFESSAMTNLNVDAAFEQLISQIYNNRKRLFLGDMCTSIRLQQPVDKEERQCCK